MKKILSLLALTMLCIVGAKAQTTLIDYPTSKDGITISGTTAWDNSQKYHANADAVSNISFANGYTTNGVINDNYAELSVEGGFKAGDVITVAGYFNNNDETKQAGVQLFVGDKDEAATVLWTSELFINGRTVADDPTAQSYTLEADYTTLKIGRSNGLTGATRTNLTLVTVVRPEEAAPATKSVTFTKPESWSSVWVWAWSGSGDNIVNLFESWPGLELTANAEGKYVWETTESPEYIIFSDNGATQTANLAFVDGAEYTVDGIVVNIESMTVVGTFLGLNGDDNWSFANGLAMTQDADNPALWTATMTDVALQAGTYYYKAAANNNWSDLVIPSGDNASFTCEADGIYTITFTANTDTKECTAVTNKTGDIEPIYVYAVVGEGDIFSGYWDTNTTDLMTLNEETGICTWTAKFKELTAQTIQYKVIKKATNVTADVVWYPSGDNQTIEIAEDGVYTITITFDTATEEVADTKEMREKKVFADNNVYYWESPDGYQDQNGGEAVHNNGVRVNYTQAGYYTICLNGKNDFSTDIVTITLNEGVSLKAGDQIAITAFRNKNTAGSKSGAKLKFGDDSENTLTIGDGLAFNNINTAEAVASEFGEPNTITAEIPEAADGATTITLTRSSTNTNLFITKIEITRPEVEDEEPAYYLVGNMNDWTPAEAYQLKANDETEGEYMITLDLYNGNEFKIVSGEGDSMVWYPDGTDNNYKVTTDGNYTVYFRPDGQGSNNWHYGVIYVYYNGDPTGINGLNAAQENAVIFNMQGVRVQNATKGLYIVNGKKLVVK